MHAPDKLRAKDVTGATTLSCATKESQLVRLPRSTDRRQGRGQRQGGDAVGSYSLADLVPNERKVPMSSNMTASSLFQATEAQRFHQHAQGGNATLES